MIKEAFCFVGESFETMFSLMIFLFKMNPYVMIPLSIYIMIECLLAYSFEDMLIVRLFKKIFAKEVNDGD